MRLTTEQAKEFFVAGYESGDAELAPRYEAEALWWAWLDSVEEIAYLEGYAARGSDEADLYGDDDLHDWEDE